MRGTVNTPGGRKKTSLEDIGAQKKLTGTAGQYVGFNAKGEAIAQDPLKGSENQYIGFDEKGNQIVKDMPENGESGSTSSATAFFGTIGTEWEEDAETGVKTQLVSIEGVMASHSFVAADVVNTHDRTSEGYALFVEEQNQFLEFITNGEAETVDGGIMFYIFGDAPTVEIPIGMGVF